MQWVIDNWFLLLILVVFIGMHLYGRGCCGYGKHEKHSNEEGGELKGHSEQDSSGEKTHKSGQSCCH